MPTESQDRAQSKRRLGQFGLLLVALVFLMAVLPFLPGGGDADPITLAVWSAVILAGLFSVSDRRRVLIAALVFAAPALIGRWVAGYIEYQLLPIANSLLVAGFLTYTTVEILRSILSSRKVTTDLILGTVNVYLLVGIVFSQLHLATELSHEGAYSLGGQSLTEVIRTTPADVGETFLYYSFTTLTTLGYGDIHPTFELARVLSTSEAILGQLFVAILIARLVSIQASQEHAHNKP